MQFYFVHHKLISWNIKRLSCCDWEGSHSDDASHSSSTLNCPRLFILSFFCLSYWILNHLVFYS